ncbi:MAG TPA: threonine synthase, partial [Lachnospiraceae bacterium]|nr:threonine synthase [Lachnospiraceae bacterium]
STASPYKFARSVMTAIDSEYEKQEDFTLIDKLCKLSQVAIPKAIEDIRKAPVLHDTVCEKEEMPAQVKGFLGL